MKYIAPILAGIVLGSLLLGVGAYFGFHTTPKSVAGGINQGYGSATSSTASGTTAATTTIVASVGTTFYVTDVTGSSDLSGATIKVLSGSTVIWQDRVSNTAAYSHTFSQPLNVGNGATTSVVVTGTSASYADVSGYTIP